MYSQQQQPLSNLSRSLPPTPSQLHPAMLHESDPVPDDYFAEAEDVPLPFPIQTIVADPQTGLSLTLISALGAGSYAVVYLAKELASGTLYALKCLGKDKLTEEEVAVQRNEGVIHTSLPPHRNIIHLLNMFETTNHLFLLLEYSSGMDMYQWISMKSDNSDPITGEPYTLTTRYEVIKTVFDQVLEGVDQVHQCGVAHRDLKPENFLIEYVDGQYTVKITDFGLATTDLESDEFECGSKPYMSFECRNGLDPYYDVQLADLWSLGIILINLLYHRCPWSDPCPLESYAFSEFLRGRVDFLQRRFEDMPGPVARWLGLKAFSFAAFGNIKTRKHNRPRLKDWKEWMNDFVDRMLGQIEPLSDDEDDDEGEYETTQEDRKFMALFEDGYERQETMGDEPEGEDQEEDEEGDNQVVPIAIQSSSLKTQSAVPGYMGVGPQYATYHNAPQTKSPNVFMSSSVPKFDASSFYQPARLRQESWSNAIDIEGTEDAEMDFSAPILFEESEEEDTQTHGHDDNDDSAGLPMALPDDFIDPLPESNSTSGRQTPSTPTVSHLTFNTEKRHMLPQLRLDLDPPNLQRSFQDALQGGRASPGRISPRKSPGRSSPSVEMQDINTLVFIEPDASRTVHETNPGTTAGGHAIASSLPSTSHLDASLQAKKDFSKGGQVINSRTGKPIRNLQEVKAAPFVFPPLKTNTPNLQPATVDSLHSAESPTSKSGQPTSNPFVNPERGRNQGMKDTTSAFGTKQGIYVIPKRSLQGGWAGPSPLRNTESNPAAYAGGVRKENWRGEHTRGSSWTPEDFSETRRGSSDRYRGDGYRAGSGRTRTRMDDRDDGPGGLPPRAQNKFRPPRYRQGRGRYPANTVTSALPPAPPTARSGFGNAGAPRSRHQSRSGSVFENGPSWTQQHNPPNHADSAKPTPTLKDNTPRDGPKYEHSQLRTHAKTNSGSAAMTQAAMAAAAGISKLSGQRNKSLVDLRGLDATNQPWRQTGSTSTPTTPVIPKTRSQTGSNGAGDTGDRQQRSLGSKFFHPLEPPTDAPAVSPVKSRLTDRLQEGKEGSGAGAKGDNVYHPPHWHERRSVSNAGASPRPISGTENDFMGWQRSDGHWNEGGGHSSKSRSGSKARQPGGAHPLAAVPLPSPTLDRKYGTSTATAAATATAVAANGTTAPPTLPSRLAGGSDSNWREGGRESFGVSESRDHVNGNNKRGPSLDQGGPLPPPTSLSLSSVSAPPTLSKASMQGARMLESPAMTFTPPTPNVNIKHDFLVSDPPTAGGNINNNNNNTTTDSMTEEAKKIVRPGAMAGLGTMLRGLVAYNKSIKVGGESVLDPTSTTSSSTAINDGTQEPTSPPGAVQKSQSPFSHPTQSRNEH